MRLDDLENDLRTYPPAVRHAVHAIDHELDGLGAPLSITRLSRKGRFLGLAYKAGRRTVARLDPKRKGDGWVMAMVPRGAEHTPMAPILKRHSRASDDFVRIETADAHTGARFVADMARAALKPRRRR